MGAPGSVADGGKGPGYARRMVGDPARDKGEGDEDGGDNQMQPQETAGGRIAGEKKLATIRTATVSATAAEIAAIAGKTKIRRVIEVGPIP